MLAGISLDDGYKIAGIVSALVVSGVAIRAIIRGSRHVRLVHEAIVGRPKTDVSEEIPGMIARFSAVNAHLAAQDTILAQVKGELSYNGGGSTKDQVRSLVREVGLLKAGQEQAKSAADEVAAELREPAKKAAPRKRAAAKKAAPVK